VERIGALALAQTTVSGRAEAGVNCGPPMDDVRR
jgi:hypothetical protein